MNERMNELHRASRVSHVPCPRTGTRSSLAGTPVLAGVESFRIDEDEEDAQTPSSLADRRQPKIDLGNHTLQPLQGHAWPHQLPEECWLFRKLFMVQGIRSWS